MQVSQDLLNDIQFIDVDMVYEVSCREGSHKFKLEVFAEDYPTFKSILDDYLSNEPDTIVINIKPLTPEQYETY